MSLFLASGNNLASSKEQKSGIAQIGRIKNSAFVIKRENANGCRTDNAEIFLFVQNSQLINKSADLFTRRRTSTLL